MTMTTMTRSSSRWRSDAASATARPHCSSRCTATTPRTCGSRDNDAMRRETRGGRGGGYRARARAPFVFHVSLSATPRAGSFGARRAAALVVLAAVLVCFAPPRHRPTAPFDKPCPLVVVRRVARSTTSPACRRRWGRARRGSAVQTWHDITSHYITGEALLREHDMPLHHITSHYITLQARLCCANAGDSRAVLCRGARQPVRRRRGWRR